MNAHIYMCVYVYFSFRKIRMRYKVSIVGGNM